jgi:hypothetical protein
VRTCESGNSRRNPKSSELVPSGSFLAANRPAAAEDGRK